MEYIILGLLIFSPMTGYELQQFIKKNLALICSHSAGSVQTALAKLEKDGKIMVNETVDGRRHKKVFHITDTGRTDFLIWIAQPMQAEKIKNMELSKLFFAGLAKPEERITAIKDYICQMEKTKSMLYTIKEYFRQMKEEELPPGINWAQVLCFQGYTIEYGIAAAEFEIGWYSRLLRKLEESL